MSYYSQDSQLQSRELNAQEVIIEANLVAGISDLPSNLSIDNSTITQTLLTFSASEKISKCYSIQVLNRVTGAIIPTLAVPVVVNTPEQPQFPPLSPIPASYKISVSVNGAAITNCIIKILFVVGRSSQLSSINFIGLPGSLINFGLSSPYRVVARSGISATTGTSVSGDIAISTASSNFITGFGLVPDNSGLYSTSSLVSGNIYAPDYGVESAASLALVNNAMGAAYTDAQGRAATFNEEGAGSIGGLILNAGVHRWSTDVSANTDMILNGSPTDSVILQVGGTFNLAATRNVVLTGGLLPQNVYLVSAGVVTLGANSIFRGNILAATDIIVQNAATVHGRLYAQNNISLIAANIAVPVVNFVGLPGSLINFGAASTYRIIARSTMSSTAGTTISGDIAISPAAASFITGFGLVLDNSNMFSTSSLVTGNVYAANYAAPTPANLTIANAAIDAAYTDGAGRASNFNEEGAGSIGGLTLSAGVHKWTSNVNAATSVTLNGSASDTVILQVSGTFNLAASQSILLTGGLLPQNVYLVVAGAVTLGVSSVFRGNILAATSIAIQTTATVHGRLYAQTAITIDDATIGA